ncbi:rRNA methyltransferase 3B, mitochondrial [Clarias gariepinus]|uniref:rRNA methyltransferase 3B, mitochondrial n=1 Tax=Clarias gariepinus TaxID=13013 RepID=UPI00234C8B2F|nr:rRNA methyltransferase 3B, mitochondrial [Clarias gariepinus]
MAALMRCPRAVCTILGSAQTQRISKRFVRPVRRRAPGAFPSTSYDDDSINLKSEVKHEQVKGAEGLGHTCPPSAQESRLGHRDATKSHHEKIKSKPQDFHQMEGLRYERTQPDDVRVTRLVNLARSKKLREQQGKILVEGRRLISDALGAGASPLTIFFSTLERLQELPVNKITQASLVKVKMEDVQIWPDHTALDMIAIFKRPEVSRMSFSEETRGKALPLTLICDNVRDPGNLGATLRCAAAAGCHSVLLSTGCVDAWEPKVLRAGMGAHFRLPIIPSLSWTEIQLHLPHATTVHVADNSTRSMTESEHAHLTPQRHRKAGDLGWISSRQNSRKEYDEDEDEEDEVGGFKQTGPVLKTLPYHRSWTGSHTAIVIGGETHGLSQEALQLAEETRGRRLLIPMVRGVDSLNAAMAASVLLFEGRRQLMTN